MNTTFVLDRHLRGHGYVDWIACYLGRECERPTNMLAMVFDCATKETYPAAVRDLKPIYAMTKREKASMGLVH